MRLRQIALVANDLAAVRADISQVLHLDYAYEDPGVGKYGLRNAVFPIGDTFLEVVSPNAPGTAAGRLLDKRGGDGGYMVILQVENLIEARSRVSAAGVRIADQFDGDGVAFTHLHPKDVGGAILSLDYMHPRSRWDWGGPEWAAQARSATALAIVGAELQSADPGRMAARWVEVLGRPATRLAEGWRIALEAGELLFVAAKDGRGEGLGAFDLKVRDPRAVEAAAAARGLVDPNGNVTLAGTRVRLRL